MSQVLRRESGKVNEMVMAAYATLEPKEAGRDFPTPDLMPDASEVSRVDMDYLRILRETHHKPDRCRESNFSRESRAYPNDGESHPRYSDHRAQPSLDGRDRLMYRKRSVDECHSRAEPESTRIVQKRCLDQQSHRRMPDFGYYRCDESGKSHRSRVEPAVSNSLREPCRSQGNQGSRN
ncbi:hypothetical protein QAD02_021231 [Eretmocerus hayati]|uniref:Uncharacterized protein n=1 Tax=Eretmocerus hayati TaxID=131215 RepID=A0ACC2PQZ9_9HYME|nr:hypothetical protein QAD02_021231 [Eretmocerus hayati]